MNQRANSLRGNIEATNKYGEAYRNLESSKNRGMTDFGTSAVTTLGSMFL
jgi:hypothetical protein